MATTDPAGARSTFGYDPLGRVTSITDALGGMVTSAYDPTGRLVSVTDPIGALRTYAYDTLGNLVSETDPAGRVTTHTYDAAKRRTSVTDGRGITRTYTYDPSGRITATTSPDGAIATTYDASGRRTSVTDAHATTTFTYDPTGKTTEVASAQGTLSYAYDPAGRRTSMSTPAGAITYAYDPVGNLATLSDPAGRSAAFSYDLAGQRTRATFQGVTSTSTYDQAGRRTSLRHATPSATLASYDLTYDAAGNTTAIATPTSTRSFTYDATRRLTSETTPTGTTSYTYDQAGNRTSVTSPAGTTTYAYTPSGELASLGSQALTHDGAGNVTAIGSDTFSYDAYGRLTHASVAGTSQSATYDADGIRTSLDGSAHLVDRQRPLATLVADATHTYLAADDFAAQLSATTATSLLADPQGSIAHLVDASGTPTGTASYDAFATKTTTGATSALGFAGQEHDPTGLVHLRARTYAPSLGRFLQPDPVQPSSATTLGWNRYTYANDNPLSFSDPTGATPFSLSEQSAASAAESDLQAGAGSGAWATARLIIDRLQGYLYRAVSSRIGQCLAASVPDPTNATGVDVAVDLASGCVDEALDALRGIRRLGRAAGAVCRANSFAPKTLVLMANGTRKPISEVREGDYVYATDPETGETGAREVLATMPHTDQLLTLKTSSGDVVTTEDHRYWNATDSEWQESQHLDEGDRLLTTDGEIVTVEGLDWSTVHTDDAYDLTVAEFHSFYVAAGDDAVLVHNCSPRAYDIADKTIERHGLMGFKDADDMARYIDDVVNRQPGILRDDGALLYRDGDNIIIIPGNYGSPGTLFRPDNPNAYWERELQRTQYGG